MILDLSSQHINYSKIFWENLLHLLENSANINFPMNNSEGSLWYDSYNKVLKISIKSEYGFLEWKPLQPEEIDFSKYIDVYKTNEISNLILVDDIEGDTVYDGENKNSDHAVTKKYVDNYHGNIKEIVSEDYHGFIYPNKYIILYGIKAGDITLPYEMNGIKYSVACSNSDSFKYGKITNKTSKSFTVNSNNWIMCGYSL